MNGWQIDPRDPDELAAAARWRAERAGDNPLGPARGCLHGLALAAPFWLLAGGGWLVWRAVEALR